MARTRKNTETPDNVIPLRTDSDEQPVDDQLEEQVQPESDEQCEPEQAPEPQRSRGPALNRVELIGRIAKAPEVHVTPGGVHVAYFRVATNGREDRDTEFHQCVAFGRTAEFLAEHVGTGRLVYLEGRLQTRPYDDRDGIRRWVTSIAVNRLQILDSRRREDQ